MKNKKKFKKIVKYESFLVRDSNKENNFLLFLTAIPFIGTCIVLLYFLVRNKDVYFEEILPIKRGKNGN